MKSQKSEASESDSPESFYIVFENGTFFYAGESEDAAEWMIASRQRRYPDRSWKMMRYNRDMRW